MHGPTGAAEPRRALAKQDKRDPSPNLQHPQPAVSPALPGVTPVAVVAPRALRGEVLGQG